MIYAQASDLPPEVRADLPPLAHETYRTAYNAAWEEYANPTTWFDGRSREEMAHLVAWATAQQTAHNARSAKPEAVGDDLTPGERLERARFAAAKQVASMGIINTIR
jgi:cation transport regulator